MSMKFFTGEQNKKNKIFNAEAFAAEFKHIYENELEKNLATNLGLDLPSKMFDISLKYASLLLEKNCYMNLTAVTEARALAYLHFYDSLTLEASIKKLQESKKIPLNELISLADIGTGAGFPGLYNHLIFPKKNLYLIDSLQKRLNFLDSSFQTLSKDLDLKRSEPIFRHGRAEFLAHDKELREKMDLVCARAVASLPVLLEYCIPFLKRGAYFWL